MDSVQLTAALRAKGALDGHNIDQQCYYFAQVTGTPCPQPESFGAGDRSKGWGVADFALIAARGFSGLGETSPGGDPPTTTIPIDVAGGGNTNTGGGNTNTGGGGNTNTGGGGTGNTGGLGNLFGGGTMPIILIGVLAWVVFKK